MWVAARLPELWRGGDAPNSKIAKVCDRAAAGNGYFTTQRGMPTLETPEVLGRLLAARVQSVAEDENEYLSLNEGRDPHPADRRSG